MLSEHIFLTIFWMLYCVIHSILANDSIKRIFTDRLNISINTYRVLYNILALVGLISLLLSHFSVKSHHLFQHNQALQVLSLLFISTGGIIMIICIIKYFKQLSGLKVSSTEAVAPVLETTGVHKYVRHPLYLGTFIFLIGLFLWSPLLNNLIAVLTIIIYTIIGIYFEEQKLVNQFGKDYVEYQKRVPMLLPLLKR